MRTTHPKPAMAYLGLAIGVIAVSFAAVFIRLADAPFLVVSAFRMSLASLVVVPAAVVY